MSSLNKAQFEAVNALDGPVMILAGAGTGKTRTVTCRIAHLIDQGCDPSGVLAVTFTNKAAAEMKERIGDMISQKAAKEMMVCTFHSLCVRILRQNIEELGYKKNFSIIMGGDQTGLIKQLIVRKGGSKEKIMPGEVLSKISSAKNAGIAMEDIEDSLISAIGVAYRDEIRAQNAVDFDDLLLLGEKLLTNFSHVRRQWQERFSHITVDEFQDTNALQMRLIQRLVDEKRNICVVGDDDQSIYGWRGAEVANILEFERFFSNPRIIRLEENYRSSEAILHTANSLIKHNIGRREKALIPTKAGGEPVKLISMPGDEEEAQFIAQEMKAIHDRGGKKWEDFAILFRTNGQSRKLEEAMRELKIPYRMVGAQSFYDRREVRDVLAYIELLANQEADVPLLRILNSPPRGIGQSTIVQAVDHSREMQQSVWESLNDEGFRSQLGARPRNAIIAFNHQLQGYIDRIQTGSENAGHVVKEFISEIDYVDFIHRGCKTPDEAEKRSEGIHDVIAQLAKASDKGKTLRVFLDESSLASDRDDDDIEKKQGATLITMHASKGLEFPNVYIVGLEQGILPHSRSVEEGTVDEERRLLYVGVTRAQITLTLSYCSIRTKWGDKVSCTPSQFLQEFDVTFIDETSYEDIMGTEISDEEAADFFSSMRAMLLEDSDS